jgi:hypothetical protein
MIIITIHGKILIINLCDYIYCRYDANTKAQSHRFYKETITTVSTPNRKGRRSSLPIVNFQWETLASNLEEFSEVAVRTS